MIRITRSVTKVCPHKGETDFGSLTLSFAENAPELHDLGRQIDCLALYERLTHEDYTRAIAELVPDASIETKWFTGGWHCEVTE